MCWQAMEVDEYMIYHYMTPRKLLAVDQRVQHEKLDRMVRFSRFCLCGANECVSIGERWRSARYCNNILW